ncbi:helix-turn-helix transcriptional regulator [Microbacterium paludicola]|uniref:helix-turn-helix domain-containing protein n=1 Tax=Microbacterium paludicola TaxID=300019 RepID=UPI0031DCD4C7
MTDLTAAAIGARIAMYRKALRLTAEDLARELAPDVTGNAIAKLENGHRAQVAPAMVADIARVLGVSPLALLFPLQDPDAVVVVNGMRSTVREMGQWLFGLRDEDTVTETFRQLIASDRALALAEARLRSASTDDARARMRQLVSDERERQLFLLGVLESNRRILERDGLTDGEH